jgi:hypothetical protein
MNPMPKRLGPSIRFNGGVPAIEPSKPKRHSPSSRPNPSLTPPRAPGGRIVDVLGHRSTTMLEEHNRHRVRNAPDGHLKYVGEIVGQG